MPHPNLDNLRRAARGELVTPQQTTASSKIGKGIGKAVAVVFAAGVAGIILLGSLSTIQPSRVSSEALWVRADSGWQETGLFVEEDEICAISVLSGQWSPWPGYTVGAGGCDSRRSECPSDHDYPDSIVDSPHAGLIGRVADAPAFSVGDEGRFRAGSSGRVQLRINDRAVQDNAGAIEVRVRVER